ncbi:general transcription factor 3C polypeptide 3-like [Montipora capricornis]|uniref:general transcription factor 3C polypeptide 3-like n=1 Tax=Montipora capricornis TaxID=246305 RepID=UPI0035F19EAE
MEDEQISVLMKYVRGEISFTEWIESGGVTADKEQDDENEVEMQDGDNEVEQDWDFATQEAQDDVSEELRTTDMVTFLVPDTVFDALSEMPVTNTSSQESIDQVTLPTEDTSMDPGDSHSAQTSQPSIRMTDLLLRGSGAKSAQKHGGTGVDEFMQEIPATQRRRTKSKRRKRFELPPKLKQTMGRANILWARGEIEEAKAVCMELIRQVPNCSEPFQTLGMMFEEQEDKAKALQFFLIAAYLSKSGDADEWAKLAMMSLELNDYDQAMTCYNQALKLEPANVAVLWDCAALCYQMDNSKKALEYYEKACQALSSSGDGAKYIDLVCELAKLYHENKSLKEATNILDAAFSKFPNHVNNQAINMLADLHMTSKAYETALQVILKHCDAKKEEVSRCSEESPLTSFSLLMSPNHRPDLTDSQSNNEEAKTNLILPEDFPIDLRVKIVVCLIYLRNLYPIKDLLYPLFLQSVDNVGDLYIDVADAYTENGDYEEALPILNILLGSNKYNVAGIWLRKGDCLHSDGRLEEAVSAYTQVVHLAPNHLEARLILASLHQQLGRPNQALEVLDDPRCSENTGDASENDAAIDTSSVYTEESDTDHTEKSTVQPREFRLLFHKCALLHSQNRSEEFMEAGMELFKLFLMDVYDSKGLAEMALKSNRFQTKVKKIEALVQEETRSKASVRSDNKVETGIRTEEWWDMFKKVVSKLSHHKRHADAQKLVLCALSSERFSKADYQIDLVFMSMVALYLNREYQMAFDASKILVLRDRHKPIVWNLMARITAKSGDSRHQRYILRLLIKHPDELPLVLFSGHNAAVSASYRFAIGEYVRAFRQVPHDPLVTLCLGLQYLHLACQRFPRSRHSCVVQGIIFMFQYLGLRGECQEAYYNLARAFHQLGLLQFALHYYNKALEFPLHEALKNPGQTPVKFSDKHDLHRETAFNLSLIYRASGNEIMAKELLMKHCWV